MNAEQAKKATDEIAQIDKQLKQVRADLTKIEKVLQVRGEALQAKRAEIRAVEEELFKVCTLSHIEISSPFLISEPQHLCML